MTLEHQDDQQPSTFRKWIGIAAADRSATSPNLMVTVPELMPSQQGQVSAASTVSSVSLSTMSGSNTHAQVSTTNVITAIWYGESNRKYPPNVKKGEQVEITKYGDTDRYYWSSMGRDMGLRGQETHRIEVANNSSPQSSTGSLSDTNTYFMEMSTESGRVLIKTSQSGGESHMFQILIDTKNNQIQLCDEANNEVLIDSGLNRVRLRNNLGCFVDLLQQQITIAAPQDIILKADRQIVLAAPTITENASGTLALQGANIGIGASGTAVIAGNNVGVNGTTTKIGGNLQTGPLQSESSSTGSLGSPFQIPTTNISNGTGT